MRLGHLGPAGTYTEEAARPSAAAAGAELVPYPTVQDTVGAVLAGAVDAALVPIENSLEGTVTATVDALSAEARLRMVGEAVLGVRHCLIARDATPLDRIDEVRSHPQALAQCARFLGARLPEARLVAVGSTAEAVRSLDGPSVAAIASRGAAELQGGVVLEEGIEDEDGNATRFAWLALDGAPAFPPPADGAPWKTSVLFAGAGDDNPGWLVRCLSEFAFRGVNLVKIESRPARRRLGHYLFLADCEGREDEPAVAGALEGLRAHCDQARVLGSYPAAPGP
ncbi:MAG: pheA [Solirubrobacterales bacterium]|nr:pheA [Solirubrobacterales bacterium]